MLDYAQFTHLTFDCYGTLIDWETGILHALGRILRQHDTEADAVTLLQLYAKHEAAQEVGAYKSYRDVLRGVMAGIAHDLEFEATQEDQDALADSVGDWPPFDDTIDALQALKRRYKLVIVSNIDDDLFAQSNELLEVSFDEIITAQQVRSYKPGHAHFNTVLERLGVPQSKILHVAQSLYHDHAPAKTLGFSTVWVNRQSILPGTGLSLPVDARPDREVPDMASLVRIMGL